MTAEPPTTQPDTGFTPSPAAAKLLQAKGREPEDGDSNVAIPVARGLATGTTRIVLTLMFSSARLLLLVFGVMLLAQSTIFVFGESASTSTLTFVGSLSCFVGIVLLNSYWLKLSKQGKLPYRPFMGALRRTKSKS